MAKKETEYQYGIKYRVVKLTNNKFILFPIALVKGKETLTGFQTDKEKIPYIYEEKDLKNRYVVDTIYQKDELEYVYDYEDDEKFLTEYFYDDYKDTIIYVTINPKTKELNKNEINLRIINNPNIDETYGMYKSIPSILLNEKALNEILSCDNLEESKLLLKKYQRLIQSFKGLDKKKGITKINVLNGKINFLETDRKIELEKEPTEKNTKKEKILTSDSISYNGLRNYLKERIYGHEEEIDTFAQKLYMNYTAEKGETIESILLVGPTGVGKTETVRAACNYLNIPFYEVNASNIVPQGIKGMSIEDVIIGLYEQAGQNIEKAERGLIFLDEFDKLNDSDIDLKSSVKNILLTFTGGGVFPIDNNQYNFQFNSTMTNKVYAGVFDRIHNKEKVIGFNKEGKKDIEKLTEEEIRRKIIEKGYFSPEELTRISTILGYSELDRKTKKEILMNSKLSEFAKKKDRYKRQFGIDLIADDSYIEAILDSIEKNETGMRIVNNLVKRTINNAEKELLENEKKSYKKLILTKDTVLDSKKFDLA